MGNHVGVKIRKCKCLIACRSGVGIECGKIELVYPMLKALNSIAIII